MTIWSEQDAQGRFDEWLAACLTQGPQALSRDGVVRAVLVPIEQWLQAPVPNGPSLKALLLSEEPRLDFELPLRGQRGAQ